MKVYTIIGRDGDAHRYMFSVHATREGAEKKVSFYQEIDSEKDYEMSYTIDEKEVQP